MAIMFSKKTGVECGKAISSMDLLAIFLLD